MSSLSLHYNHSHPDILPSKAPQLSHPDILPETMPAETIQAETMPTEAVAEPAEEEVVQDKTAYQTDLSTIELPSTPFRIVSPGVETEVDSAATEVEVSPEEPEEIVEEVAEEVVEEVSSESIEPEVSLNALPAPVEEKPKAPSQPKSPRKPRSVMESRRPRSVMQAIEFYGHDEDFRPVKSGEDKKFVPTSAAPGSPEKLEILAERAKLGFDLWHDEDRSGYGGTIPGVIRPRD